MKALLILAIAGLVLAAVITHDLRKQLAAEREYTALQQAVIAEQQRILLKCEWKWGRL